jgi:hypothetical protein
MINRKYLSDTRENTCRRLYHACRKSQRISCKEASKLTREFDMVVICKTNIQKYAYVSENNT